jgi:DNA-binding XRE family transcriptional regulator
MNVGRRMQVLRAARQISQSTLAETLGVNRNVIWQVESGQMLPGAELEATIREALGWTPEVDAALDALAAALGLASTGSPHAAENSA